MKRTAIASTAVASLAAAFALAAPANAATYQEVVETVDTSAFADADDNWRRIMVNRESDCGSYGKEGKRRIDVLIERYNTLAAAIDANDENAAMKAGERLSAAIDANPRFSSCWSEISRRTGVSVRVAHLF